MIQEDVQREKYIQILNHRYEDCAWGKSKHGDAELYYQKLHKIIGFFIIVISAVIGMLASISLTRDYSQEQSTIFNISNIVLSAVLIIFESLDKFNRFNYKALSFNHKSAKEEFRSLQKEIELVKAEESIRKLKRKTEEITKEYNNFEGKYPSADKFYNSQKEEDIIKSNKYKNPYQ